MKKDTVVVYWSPAAFNSDSESWNLLYPEPELVKTKLQKKHTDFKRNVFMCPAFKDSLNNLYCLKSAVDDHFYFNSEALPFIANEKGDGVMHIPSTPNPLVAFSRQRPSSIDGHINVAYNLSWLFFCEEPLLAKFFPPFLPVFSPVANAILAVGEFDIGQWYRPYNLDYHIPVTSTEFKVSKEDELSYVKFETNKKVILKRYILNKTLFNYSKEMSVSSDRYGRFQSLANRYAMANNSGIRKLILKEIKNNLVD